MGVAFHCSACADRVFPTPFVKRLSFLPRMFSGLSHQVLVHRIHRVLILGCCRFHWSMCLLLCQYHSVFTTVAL